MRPFCKRSIGAYPQASLSGRRCPYIQPLQSTFGSKRSRNRGIFDTTSRPKSKKKYNNTLAFTYLCICCNTIYAEVAKPGHNPLHERQALTECDRFANGRSALILKLRFRGAVVLIFNLCNRGLEIRWASALGGSNPSLCAIYFFQTWDSNHEKSKNSRSMESINTMIRYPTGI